MRDSARVRRCKAIRDRIYNREHFGYSVFEREVIELLSFKSTILDIGCGRNANFLRSLSSCVKRAYGIDLEVSDTITDGNLQIMNGDAEEIPLPDHSVDITTLINVSEHLRDPEAVFLECRRILKPGGSLFIIAPCKFYLPTLLGRAIPYSIRQWANVFITCTEKEETFPAYYRANSRYALKRIAASVGLSMVDFKYLTYHPELFMFSPVVYSCAVVIERFFLERKPFYCFRHQVFCHLRNPLVCRVK